MSERFKAYITKYALSSGITLEEVEDWFNISPTMVSSMKRYKYYHKGDWHRSWSSAQTKAEDMRRARIASLKRQLEKLESLTFGSPTDHG